MLPIPAKFYFSLGSTDHQQKFMSMYNTVIDNIGYYINFWP